MSNIPSCRGWARFNTWKQANYVALQSSIELDCLMKVFDHGDHFHVAEVENENQ